MIIRVKLDVIKLHDRWKKVLLYFECHSSVNDNTLGDIYFFVLRHILLLSILKEMMTREEKKCRAFFFSCTTKYGEKIVIELNRLSQQSI